MARWLLQHQSDRKLLPGVNDVETVVLLSKGVVDKDNFRKVKVDFSLEDMDLTAEGFCVMKFVIVNLITGLRIIIGLIMLFFPALSTEFYICYFFAGFTDMIDGTIAGILGAESQFGEKFDTFADSVFVASSLCKLLPVIDISTEIWIWIGIIAVIKVINIISGIVVQKRIVAVHSRVNKLTGFVLFALPFSFSFIDVMYSSAVVCLLATFAALHEGYLIRKGNLEGSKNAVS